MNKKIMILLIGLFLVINVIIAGCSEQKVMKKDDVVEKEEAGGGTGLEDDLNESENEEVGVEELDDLDSEFEEIEDLDI